MNDTTRSVGAINSFGSRRILVIGDLMLDVYLKGKSTRLCPEAPVPVVDIEEKTVLPGGAANTACNLRALGASVILCSVIGVDAEGSEAEQLLTDLGIDGRSIVRDPNRRTITKSRVVSGSQVITRMDQGSEQDIGEHTAAVLMAHIEKAYVDCDAVIISDYKKGVVTDALLAGLLHIGKKHSKFLAVDSKRPSFFAPLRPSYMKPNYEEMLKVLGLDYATDRIQQVKDHAHDLFTKTNAPLITVTLDADGSLILYEGRVIHHVPAAAVARPHVAGAGDTYISAFVLAYLFDGDASASAEIATSAAAIVINKECTGACTQRELKYHFNIYGKCIENINDLKSICDAYRASGKRLVFTNGCFDILHSGHVAYLRSARELGDILIVGLNTDESIKRIKGNHRPINRLADRLQVLAGLSTVDHIIGFGDETDDTPIPLIRAVRPHIFVKGGDYTKEKLPEAETVEAYGGEIVFVEQVPDHSTTRIINKITALATTEGLETALSGSGS